MTLTTLDEHFNHGHKLMRKSISSPPLPLLSINVENHQMFIFNTEFEGKLKGGAGSKSILYLLMFMSMIVVLKNYPWLEWCDKLFVSKSGFCLTFSSTRNLRLSIAVNQVYCAEHHLFLYIFPNKNWVGTTDFLRTSFRRPMDVLYRLGIIIFVISLVIENLVPVVKRILIENQIIIVCNFFCFVLFFYLL